MKSRCPIICLKELSETVYFCGFYGMAHFLSGKPAFRAGSLQRADLYRDRGMHKESFLGRSCLLRREASPALSAWAGRNEERAALKNRFAYANGKEGRTGEGPKAESGRM
jgi:hypothetical protein